MKVAQAQGQDGMSDEQLIKKICGPKEQEAVFMFKTIDTWY